ncbi:hypothetical protein ABPG75_004008 [Micractinium tetrahymenae]
MPKNRSSGPLAARASAHRQATVALVQSLESAALARPPLSHPLRSLLRPYSLSRAQKPALGSSNRLASNAAAAPSLLPMDCQHSTIRSSPGVARRPLFDEHHSSASVLMGRVCNDGQLRLLPPKDQFEWLHRFYSVVDRIIGQHKVYKLYGGAQGFMLSAGVAEPDKQHAASLLRCALHLHTAAREIKLPGGTPIDLCLALASGEAHSGLLGSASLTYQIVGRCVQEAQELLDSQAAIPLLIADSMHRELSPEVTQGLVRLGGVGLDGVGLDLCSQGEQAGVYSLPRYGHMALVR